MTMSEEKICWWCLNGAQMRCPRVWCGIDGRRHRSDDTCNAFENDPSRLR